jgi:hypothetical protein
MTERAEVKIRSHMSRIGARFRVTVMTFRPEIVAPFVRMSYAVILFVPRMLSAQSATPSAPATPLCWTAQRLPACKSWIVTDLSVSGSLGHTSAPLSQGRKQPDFEPRVGLTVGQMFNRSAERANGVVFTIAGDGRGTYVSGEVRHREWINEWQAVDLSIGAARKGIKHSLSGPVTEAVGATGQVGLEFGWLGIHSRLDVMRGDNRPIVGVSMGAHLSGKRAPLGLIPLLALAYLSALAGYGATT